MKSFFPKICPACSHPLVIEVGDKSETLKLMCKNKECSGSLLKKLQKGIIALEIRGLGPKVIEKLMGAGINSSLDLFDPEIFNEKSLIASGYFQKGRSLEKIITSVKNTKSFPIHKFILSLQIDKVGKTVSEKLGMLISGLTPDFSGLPYIVRDNIESLTDDIKSMIIKVESTGVEIARNKPPKKVVATKKMTKCVAVDSDESKTLVESLGWEVVEIEDDNCKMLVGDLDDDLLQIANELGMKCMSTKKVKLLFG